MAVVEPANTAGAFEIAVRAEAGHLFGVAYSILRDVQEAEDAVQEAMELAWRSRTSLRDPSKRAAWLRQICVRRCLRIHRGLLRRSWLADRPETHADPQPANDMDLDRSFRLLTRQQRAVLALHYHYGYSLDESAALMGCRPGTARSHLNRALNRMREELGHA
jgi:RNA polymerase sigma-70 factor, ECF subfamily